MVVIGLDDLYWGKYRRCGIANNFKVSFCQKISQPPDNICHLTYLAIFGVKNHIGLAPNMVGNFGLKRLP